jgi:hypothetical protein
MFDGSFDNQTTIFRQICPPGAKDAILFIRQRHDLAPDKLKDLAVLLDLRDYLGRVQLGIPNVALSDDPVENVDRRGLDLRCHLPQPQRMTVGDLLIRDFHFGIVTRNDDPSSAALFHLLQQRHLALVQILLPPTHAFTQFAQLHSSTFPEFAGFALIHELLWYLHTIRVKPRPARISPHLKQSVVIFQKVQQAIVSGSRFGEFFRMRRPQVLLEGTLGVVEEGRGETQRQIAFVHLIRSRMLGDLEEEM